LADEDDELSEVQPDAVPPEVREWLASTFTRQLATTRKKSDEKPKFRSVAHAIRAGIFVDRIYRRVSSTALMQFPPEVVKVLKVSCPSDKTSALSAALNVRRAEKLEQTKTFLLEFS
jgi:capsid protein